MGAIGVLRTLTRACRLGVIPCHVGQIGPMIEAGHIGCDVAFVQVSAADADGNHSLGLVSDYTRAAVARARVVVAEVNERVPFTYGEQLAASEIDYAVPVSRQPVEVPPAVIGGTDEAIARHAAAYVEDGSVLQIGVGAVPDAIMQPARRPPGPRRAFRHGRRRPGRPGRSRRDHQRAQARSTAGSRSPAT